MIDQMIAEDGIGYEREAIFYWLKVKRESQLAR